MGMSKPAVFIFWMGKVLFVSRQKVERSGKNIEGQVTIGWKECLLVVMGKTGDGDRMDAGFVEQAVWVEVKTAGYLFIEVIDPGSGCGGKSGLVCDDADSCGVVTKLIP